MSNSSNHKRLSEGVTIQEVQTAEHFDAIDDCDVEEMSFSVVRPRYSNLGT